MRAIISLAAQPRPVAHAAGHGPPRRVLPDAEAPAVIARRRSGLRARAGVLAGIALTILAVWALTGAPNAWPVWPLLGLGLIGALDAWLVLAGLPLLESQVARSADGGKARCRHRSVRLWAGALAILNIFRLDRAGLRKRLLLAGLVDPRLCDRSRAQGATAVRRAAAPNPVQGGLTPISTARVFCPARP